MSGRARLAAAWLFVAGLMAIFMLIRMDSGRSPSGGEIDAAAQALDAWAAFASSGELAVVRESFAEDGPQFRRLETEAPMIKEGGASYVFELTDAGVVAEGVVRGTVIVSRPGEPDQVFHWDIELVRDSDRWKLWTVQNASS